MPLIGKIREISNNAKSNFDVLYWSAQLAISAFPFLTGVDDRSSSTLGIALQ